MKKTLTELVFILDRSGSMSGLESDTIGGFNGMIKKQKNQFGEAIITTILFDDQYEILHDRMNLKAITPITDREYYVRGSTALLDAIGRTINKIDNMQKNTQKEEKVEKVMFVITTDGMENSSREYSYEKLRKMVEKKQLEDKWEFIFLGANMDAINVAESIGIHKDKAVNYHQDSRGTQLNYKAINEVVSSFRSNQEISKEWKKDVELDHKKRGEKN